MSDKKCRTCGSHDPKLHPAVQLGGEVSICSNAFHTMPDNTREDRLPEETAASRTEMLPCPNPWCNSHKTKDAEIRLMEAPIVVPSRVSYEHKVSCPVCPLDGPWTKTEDAAIAAWNRRPQPTDLVEECARRAENFTPIMYDSYYNRGFAAAQKAIARSIRALKEKPQ